MKQRNCLHIMKARECLRRSQGSDLIVTAGMVTNYLNVVDDLKLLSQPKTQRTFSVYIAYLGERLPDTQVLQSPESLHSDRADSSRQCRCSDDLKMVRDYTAQDHFQTTVHQNTEEHRLTSCASTSCAIVGLCQHTLSDPCMFA